MYKLNNKLGLFVPFLIYICPGFILLFLAFNVENYVFRNTECSDRAAIEAQCWITHGQDGFIRTSVIADLDEQNCCIVQINQHIIVKNNINNKTFMRKSVCSTNAEDGRIVDCITISVDQRGRWWDGAEPMTVKDDWSDRFKRGER